MEREKILASLSSQNDEFETKIITKSGIIGILIAFILGIVLFFVEYFVKGSANWGFLSVGTVAISSTLLIEGIYLKSKWKILFGIISGIVALFFVLAFVFQLGVC